MLDENARRDAQSIILPDGEVLKRERMVDKQAVTPLTLGGCSASDLADEFGTPLLVIDEDRLRGRMREFRAAFERTSRRTLVTYAGKALLVRALARLVHDEGLAVDVCSQAELETAVRAGVPAARCVLHGCYKTAADLRHAVSLGVGTIVIDHRDEIDALASAAAAQGASCRVLVRVNPGISAHTHRFVLTGAPDSKFGFPIADGQAAAAIDAARGKPELEVAGIHCHIGSQILDLSAYAIEVDALCDFLDAQAAAGRRFQMLDVGGGLGLNEDDAAGSPTPLAWADALYGALDRRPVARELELIVEPGRSLVSAAGTTLYRVGVRKRLPDGCDAIIVDGGMSDNPRPALYGARYPAAIASRPLARPSATFRVFGRHCETDLLVAGVDLPDPRPGDVLAVANTGAYTYAMSSNYNRFPRPAIVLAAAGVARLIARRETVDDVLRLDVE